MMQRLRDGWVGCAGSCTLAAGLAVWSLSACVSGTRERAASDSSAEAAAAAEECRQPAEQAAADASSVATETALQLISISPPTGSAVKPSTVLVADLAYTVKDFAADQFVIAARFDSTRERRTTEGSFKHHPFLMSASGTYRLCFPLNDLSGSDVKRPLSVRFVLERVDASRRHRPVAKTEGLTYRTAE